MKFSLIFAISTIFMIKIRCDPNCETELEWAKKAAEPIADFSVLLYRAISNEDVERNIVFSPLSIALSLSIVKEGASNQTRTQLRYVLAKRGSDNLEISKLYQSLCYQLKSYRNLYLNPASNSNSNFELNLINLLYYRQGFELKSDYLEKIRQCYEIEPKKCDFGKNADKCRQEINEFISNETSSKIQNLFPAQSDLINDKTVAILANSIYFKSEWNEIFVPQLFEFRPFYEIGNESNEKIVQFLTDERQILYTKTNQVSLVGVPFKNNQFYFFVILPKKRDGLFEVEKTLTGTELLYLINRAHFHQIHLKIPKFKIKYQTNLKPILISLGLNDMFTQSVANFRRMTDQKFFVDAAMHEAYIEVNENGTDAAAATGLGIKPMSMPEPAIPFVADHPFVYAIVHKPTNAIMFIGKVLSIDA